MHSPWVPSISTASREEIGIEYSTCPVALKILTMVFLAKNRIENPLRNLGKRVKRELNGELQTQSIDNIDQQDDNDGFWLLPAWISFQLIH